MEETVYVLLGEWTCSESGVWKFVVKKRQMARCVSYGKDTSFSEFEKKLVNMYGVKLTEMSVGISFCYPGETMFLSQGKMPPVSICSDVEFEEFKKKRSDNRELAVYVTMTKVVAEETENNTESIVRVGEKESMIEENMSTFEDIYMNDTQLLAYVDEVEANFKSRVGNKRGQSSDAKCVEKRRSKGERWEHFEAEDGSVEKELVDVEVMMDNTVMRIDCGQHRATMSTGSGQERDASEADVDQQLVDNEILMDDTLIEVGGQNRYEMHSEREKRFVEVEREENEWLMNIENEIENETMLTYMRTEKKKGKMVVEEETNVGVSEENLQLAYLGNNGADDELENLSDEDEPDYNFDEWTEKINEEYPNDWDPYKDAVGVESDSNGMSVENVAMEVSESSRGRNVGTMVDDLIPLGFGLGIEEGEETLRPLDIIVEEPRSCSFVEDELRAVEAAVIDGDDPILMNDAAPFHDNMRGAPIEERNMDLKRGKDALYIGRIFANKAELHDVLSIYAMRRLFTFRTPKSDKGRVIMNCVDKNCGWRIYATNHPNSENVEIKTMELKHNCDVSCRSRYGEKATAKILAGLLKSKFANGKKGPRACELPEMVLAELNVTISYMKAWNAKELAIAAARGNEEESYRFLATYLHLVKSTNPGTIAEIETKVDKKGKTLFRYLFFAFGASIAGYKYLRKVIVIDGTAMKGKYKGCFVAASGQDGNMQVYPLGFGVVDGENEGGWVWFFKNLKKFVPDDEELVFVSDRHAAIYSGLRKVYPKAQHGTCTVHLFRNVKHNFHCAGLAAVVSKAARAYTVGDFKFWWAEIVRRKPNCAKYLLKIGLPHWTLSHFPGMRYNVMSSNISESLNAALQRAVDYPIVSMVEFIRAMLMRWFWCRRTKAAKTNTRCTPEIEDLLIDHLKEAVDCAVLSCSDWIYQVNDGVGCVFTVDLENKTCTCRVFDVLKVPCCHAIAARKVRDIDIYSLIGECYFVGPWRKKYEQLVMPVPKERDTDVPEEVQEVDIDPPNTKRGGGRPRKVRIPSQGEQHGVSFNKAML